MRKKIGIFIGEIAQDYQTIVVKNVTTYANRLGYDVVAICSYGSYNENILYAEGEKACIHLPDCSVFDGIIVTEDVFDIAGMDTELYEVLKRDATCPIVYLRSSREGCYSIILENTASIENMVRHFTDVHGFTDICYMSGKAGLADTAERLDGYLNVMKEKGIPVTDHMIFHGDFWRYKGKEAMDWFMEGRTSYPQAIVCANDYMAISICEELRRCGVRVPEDVCVSGFDFVNDARINEPTLTSLEVDFEGMAKRAVDIIDEKNKGQNPEMVQRIEAKIRLHKSCGCGEQYHFDNVMTLLENAHYHINDTKNTLLSSVDYQDCFDFDEYMAVADRYRSFVHADKAFFCFADSEEKGYDDVENDSRFTKQMVLRRIFEDGKPTQKLYKKFPRKELLPTEYWDDEKPSNYCIFSIHFKNVVYGYMVTDLPKYDWFDIYTQGYLITLANAIENSVVHEQMEHLEEIRSLYQKDPLTGIYNRRGFDKLLQDCYSDFKQNNSVFALASIDMDNLKTINDTFGHAEGDRALTALANALKASMKEGDFCARIGGDEFSAVIITQTPDRVSEFKAEFTSALRRESAKIPDYSVDASVGICLITESAAASLIACVQTADKRMYEEKRSRKVDVR